MLKESKVMLFQKLIPLGIFAVFFIIYLITSGGRTPFDYFTRLAASFLDGKLFLTESPPWLSELIPAKSGEYYVVYPPMPAILSMPFVFLFKQKFEQQILAHILGAGIATLTYFISLRIKNDKKLAIWSSLFSGFGTIIWFLSATGSSWYLGQISACFFLTAGIYESLYKKRPYLIGIFLGAAFLSRLHTILSLPLFLYLLYEKKDRIKNYFLLGIGVLPFVLFNFSYNFARFGVIWDKAYILIPGLLDEPWFKKGLFHPSYIPDNLRIMFASFPILLDKFPFLKPSWAGLAIWITTPGFVYSLFNNIKEKVVGFSWISIFLISLVVLSHGTTGFAQFGYRFAVDFYPILIFLTIKAVSKTKLSWHHYFLLAFGILVNTWGVILINKFGLVSF